MYENINIEAGIYICKSVKKLAQ